MTALREAIAVYWDHLRIAIGVYRHAQHRHTEGEQK